MKKNRDPNKKQKLLAPLKKGDRRLKSSIKEVNHEEEPLSPYGVEEPETYQVEEVKTPE